MRIDLLVRGSTVMVNGAPTDPSAGDYKTAIGGGLTTSRSKALPLSCLTGSGQATREALGRFAPTPQNRSHHLPRASAFSPDSSRMMRPARRK